MIRLICPPDIFSGNTVDLTAGCHHKIANVLKMRSGEEIALLDGLGGVYTGNIKSILKNRTSVEVISRSKIPPPKCSVTLAQAVAKGKRFDFVLQKATELGVSRIVPLITRRTISRGFSKDNKIERWAEIIRHAAEQSNQAWLPDISEAVSLDQFLGQAENAEVKFIFYEEEKSKSLKSTWPKNMPASVLVIVGPEGGFEQNEVDLARNAGFTSVGLGPLILRSDTAPLVILSLIRFLAGELG